MTAISASDAAKINDGNAYCHTPVIATLKDQIYIIWHESTGIYGQRQPGAPKRASIMYRVSRDGGLSFGKTKKLYDFEGRMSAPASVTASQENNRVFACWSDTDDTDSVPYKTKILFARTADSELGTDEFEVPLYLDTQNQRGNKLANFERGSVVDKGLEPNPSGSRTPFSRHRFTPAPTIIAIGENVHVMWVGLTDLLAGQANPGDRIHVNTKVRFATSSDTGSSFGEIIDLGSYTIRDQSASANFRLRAQDNRVYALWYQFDNAWSGSMVLRKSDDSGKSFGPQLALDGMRYTGQPESTEVRLGDIAVIADTKHAGAEFFALFVVTEQPKRRSVMGFMPLIGSSAAYLVQVSIGNNNTLSFKDPVKVVDGSAGGSDVPLCVCKNFVHVVWTDKSGESMELKSSSDYGKSFGSGVSIKTPRDRRGQRSWGRYPLLVCQGGSVFVAWHHGSNTSASVQGQRPKIPPSVLYLSASSDGTSFLEPILISADEHARSGQPNLMVEDSTVYFAWAEGNEQSSDILFRKLMIRN